VREHSRGTAKYSLISSYCTFVCVTFLIHIYISKKLSECLNSQTLLCASINISSFVLFTFLCWHSSSCQDEIHGEASEDGKIARAPISVDRPNLKRDYLCCTCRGAISIKESALINFESSVTASKPAEIIM